MIMVRSPAELYSNSGETEPYLPESKEYDSPTFYQRLAEETDPEQRMLLEDVLHIAEAVQAQGGRALISGGFVRDELLNHWGHQLEPKDLDLEIFGVEASVLMESLRDLGPVNLVGESFGVLKVGKIDVSLPRRDSKVAPGHTGFLIESDPGMEPKEAARRRDFTINTIQLDPLNGQIFDEHGGLEDLQHGILRATDPNFFGDDPLRVLRAMQFVGRFDFTIEPKTLEICQGLNLSELSKERIGEEWLKLLLKSPQPSLGLEAARQLGVITKLHPQLAALFEVPQDPKYHPEGNVWTHTKMVVDEAAQIVRRQKLNDEDSSVILLAALTHDLGKPSTTFYSSEKGRIVSPGHEASGLEPTKEFLSSIHTPQNIVRRILPLVKDHLFPAAHEHPSDTAVRRLAQRLGTATIQELIWLAEADVKGRTLPWRGLPSGQALLETAERLHVVSQKPQPILQGRHLIAIGLEPGPEFGVLLREMFEAQQEGIFQTKTEALAYLGQYLSKV